MLSLAAGRLGEGDAARILRADRERGAFAGDRERFAWRELRTIMAGDKKARGGRVLWVLARGIGKTEWGSEVPWPVAARAFDDLPAIFAAAGGVARKAMTIATEATPGGPQARLADTRPEGASDEREAAARVRRCLHASPRATIF